MLGLFFLFARGAKRGARRKKRGTWNRTKTKLEPGKRCVQSTEKGKRLRRLSTGWTGTHRWGWDAPHGGKGGRAGRVQRGRMTGENKSWGCSTGGLKGGDTYLWLTAPGQCEIQNRHEMK